MIYEFLRYVKRRLIWLVNMVYMAFVIIIIGLVMEEKNWNYHLPKHGKSKWWNLSAKVPARNANNG